MRIIVNARFLTQPVSGVQRYGIECSRQIKKLYPETIFVCPDAVLHTDVALELGAVAYGKFHGHLWEQLELPAFCKSKGSPPLLNLANTAPLFYTNNFFTLHDLAFHYHPEWNQGFFAKWYNYLVPKLLNKSIGIFTVSETVKNEIITAYCIVPDKISVTYNGVPGYMKDTANSGIPKERLILCVGTFNIRKNQGKLIEAFMRSNLKESYQLVLVGDQNRVFRALQISEADLENSHVKILTRATETELRDLYLRAEMVVSVSLYEGFGIPLAEGMAAGCSLFCSEIPVYRELFGQIATFCDPENAEDIRQKLEQIAGKRTQQPHTVSGQLLQLYDYERSARIIMNAIGQMVR